MRTRWTMRILYPAMSLAVVWTLNVVGSVKGEDQFDSTRARIKKALVEHNIPSLAVAVAKNGRIIWEEGFGWADRENRVLANEHTLYSLASISKPITATGLMVLKERKRIDLDKPVNDYLGEAKLRARVGNAADATVRRVANHTSGLPLHYQFFYSDEPLRPPGRDETIRRFGYLSTAPGERFHYSNLGYGILDYVIERAAEKRFAEFMREEVFLPLGLTHMSVDVGSGLEAYQAIRYTAAGARIPFYDFDHPGASAMYASAHDLVRFAMFHLEDHLEDQRAILNDAAIEEMQVPTARQANGAGYGVGWGSFDRGGYHFVSHSGGMPGVATFCRLAPDEHVAVVVLCNTNDSLAYRLGEDLVDILLPPKPSETTSTSNEANVQDVNKFAPSSELLGTWKGKVCTHHGELPLELKIFYSGDVHVRLGTQLVTLLNGASFRDGFLRGRFSGDLGTDDARGRRYTLLLEARLRGEVLNGPITAMTENDGRGSSAVTHRVELKR
jgi:CubicO group peptidase (beta-lactamase class C family)